MTESSEPAASGRPEHPDRHPAPAVLHAPASTLSFRTAQVFDGIEPDGRPQVERQMLDETEAVRVLAYLESAPVVLAAQGFGLDRVDRGRGNQVPLTWHTDGTWVWPGSVTYYLRTYALPPESGLLDHVREREYQAPTVDPATKQAALAAVSTGAADTTEEAAGTGTGTGPGVDDDRPAEPPIVAAQEPDATSTQPPAGEDDEPSPAKPPAGAEPSPAQAESTPELEPEPEPAEAAAVAEPATTHEQEPEPATPMPPVQTPQAHQPPSHQPTPQPPPSQPPVQLPPARTSQLQVPPQPAQRLVEAAPLDDGTAFDRLREAAVDLGVPAGRYRIGAAADGAWSVLRDSGRWTVFFAERGARRHAAEFDSAQQAIAYLTGQLYLARSDGGRPTPAPVGHRAEPVRAAPGESPVDPAATQFVPTPAPSPVRPGIPPMPGAPAPTAIRTALGHAAGEPPGQRPGAEQSPFAGDDLAAAEAVPVDEGESGLPGRRGAGGSQAQWKVRPRAGEPPLTLFRDKRMVTLPAGTEVDRYGDTSGNVTFAVRTQYQHRSLPTDWINFPYHAYRVQRPVEALTGVAVPWFEQPGGGTAFILPRSIGELVADGTLVEIKS